MKTSLKKQLSWSFGLILLMLFIFFAYAIWQFNQSTRWISNIMRSNYDSVAAAQEMAIALERQDSSLLNYLFDKNTVAIQTIRENEKEFLKWLVKEQGNITEEGEEEAANEIDKAYGKYLTNYNQLLHLMNEGKNYEASSLYYQTLLPGFEELKVDIRKISTMNQQAMLDKQRQSEQNSRQAALLAAFVGGLILFLTAGVGISMTDRIIQPIRSLIGQTSRIAKGDYAGRLEGQASGELQELATAYNEMAEKLEEYRNQNLQKLNLENAKTEALVSSLQDPFFMTSPEGRIILMNESARALFDIPYANPHNHLLDERVNRADIQSNISKVLQYETIYRIEDAAFEQKGKSLHFRVSSSPVLDKEGNLVGVLTIMQDFTKFLQIDQLKSDFVSTVSHELRTPLLSIVTGSQLLLNEELGSLTKDQTELLQVINEDGQRLKQMVSDLLDLSKMQTGKMIYDFQPVDIGNLASNLLKAFRPLCEMKKIKLHFHKDANLPLIWIDTARMSLVINNLLSNALKYCDPKDGEIQVNIFQEREKVLLQVQDNGEGIPQEWLNRIFDKFVQLPNSKHKEGSGLGLALSWEIVRKHNGKLSVHNAEPKGAIFSIELVVDQDKKMMS